MKKIYLLIMAAFMLALSTSASVTVCDIAPDENGHFNCPYITSGTITWDEASHTLTLNNAVVEYIYEPPYDYVYPICLTEDATIIIQGECKLTTTGYIAIGLEGTNSKNVTIQGDGSLYLASIMRGIYLKCARLTIKDITLQTTKGIMNNGDGVLCALLFINVQADINGVIERIGEPITFQNCAITYPQDAYIEHEEYGYFIADGSGSHANHIIISRNVSGVKGDVNGDSEVNIADINAVIAVILGGDSNTAADVNGDSEINIADINAVIDIILHPNQEPDYVDLDLPSGTLWATCNIGANSPEEYGDYFAWGETTPKGSYDWNNYKWNNGSSTSLTKYCTDGYFGSVDNKTELDPEDDAAYVNWGPLWRMPSTEQQQELIDKCTWQWTQRNGVNGRLVTGRNGKTLFLPAAGYINGSSLNVAGSDGPYWSRSLVTEDPLAAYLLFFNSGYLDWNFSGNRAAGFPVRPVRVTQPSTAI